MIKKPKLLSILKISTSLFRFYYYSITKNKKKYNIIKNQREMMMALFSPVILIIMYSILASIFLPVWSASLTFLFIPLFAFNFLCLNRVNDEWYRLERERIDKEHEEAMEEIRKAREKREEERIRREFEDHIDKLYREYIRQQRENERIKERAHQRSTVDKNRLNAIKLMRLSDNPTLDEVKKAYRRLSKVHHPDGGGTQENFIRLKKAYDYLMKIL